MAAGKTNAKLEKLFYSKVGEMASGLAEALDTLRSRPASAEASEKAYHIAHRLHGAGSMYGFPCVSELGWALEELFIAVRSRRLAITPAVLETLEACTAALGKIGDGLDDALASDMSEAAWRCQCLLHDANRGDAPPAEARP